MRVKTIIPFLILVGMLLPSWDLNAQDGEIAIVASHSILAHVVRNVAGDQFEVRSLIPVRADAHSFVPSPSDLTGVAEADLVFINGAGFEEGLLDAIESAGETAKIIVASACIEIRPFGEGMHHEDDHEHEAEQNVEAADDHEDKHEDGHDEMALNGCDAHDAEFAALVGEEEGHAHFTALGRAEDIDCGAGQAHADGTHVHEAGACDPHVWMDPHNVIYWVLMIRDTLADLDHANAENYAANAHAYAQDLIALEAEFILPALEELPAENRIIISSHESLGYFATTFDFAIVTTIVPGMSTMVEPSARDIAALIELVRGEGVPAIFGDTYARETTMRTIASESGAKLVGLYSDTLSESDGPAATYLDYMRFNVTSIINALLVGESR